MTEKSLKSIVTKARERWDLQNVTIIHRIGKLKVNDQIVSSCDNKQTPSSGF